jgi:hypothetical protein
VPSGLDLLRRRRRGLLRIWAATQYVVLGAAGVGAIVRFRQPFLTGHARGVLSDFAQDYTFARTGLDSGWSKVYDLHAESRAYSYLPVWAKHFPLPYPPPVGWLAAPFTAFSVRTAYDLFETVCVVAFVVAGWLLTTGQPRWYASRLAAIVVPLCVFPVAFCVALGQVVVLQLLGIALAYRWWRTDQDVLAGLMLVVIVLHPQGLILVPLVPIVLRRWRSIWSAIGAIALVSAICVLQLRRAGIHAFVSRLQLAQHHPKQFEVRPGLSPLLLLSHHTGLKVLLVVALILCVGWITYAAGTEHLELSLASALIGSLLIAPFIHTNDLIMLAAAGWLLLRTYGGILTLAFPAILAGLSFGEPAAGTTWEHAMWILEVLLLAVLLGRTYRLQRTAAAECPPSLRERVEVI